jgi:hypothetical protein
MVKATLRIMLAAISLKLRPVPDPLIRRTAQHSSIVLHAVKRVLDANPRSAQTGIWREAIETGSCIAARSSI